MITATSITNHTSDVTSTILQVWTRSRDDRNMLAADAGAAGEGGCCYETGGRGGEGRSGRVEEEDGGRARRSSAGGGEGGGGEEGSRRVQGGGASEAVVSAQHRDALATITSTARARPKKSVLIGRQTRQPDFSSSKARVNGDCRSLADLREKLVACEDKRHPTSPTTPSLSSMSRENHP